MKLRLPSNDKLVRVACVLALVALPMMIWSIADPRVWPLLVALSLGQAIGTLSFLLFLVAVVRELRPLRGGEGRAPPSERPVVEGDEKGASS